MWGERSRSADGADEFFFEPTEGHLSPWGSGPADESALWLRLLRCLLEASRGRLNAHEAAYKLGCSTRTLQRHLRNLGTTFQAEVRAVRRAGQAA
jgi:hypothetical protein